MCSSPLFRYVVPAVAAVLLRTPGAAACPVCNTETGQQVRQGIFGPDFGYNLFVTLLPFPIFLAIAAAIHFGPPWGKSGSADKGTRG